MLEPSDYLRWLERQFDAQAQRLNESTSLEERTQSLRRMKILIDKIDSAIVSALQDKSDTKNSALPGQSTTEAPNSQTLQALQP
jgi:hypothetical protein